MEQREYWYWLASLELLGPAVLRRLLALLGSPEAVFREKKLPITDIQMQEVEKSKAKLPRLLDEFHTLEEKGLHWCCETDAEYPQRLRPLRDAPLGLFYKGALPSEFVPTAGIVGARRCTSYGESMADLFGYELAQAGVQVISGMALGVDGYAQKGAVRGGGRSFAVLGTGADVCYPESNRRLYRDLEASGGILSELPPGSPGLPFHFPLRNRIISALSDILLVIEAGVKSGSLITVDQALEQGKEVMALPGRISDPLSQGCNRLIREGAGILTSPEDVLAFFGRGAAPESRPERLPEGKAALSETQKRIFAFLSSTPMHIEELAVRSGLGLGEISVQLMEMEAAGAVRPVSSGYYIKK